MNAVIFPLASFGEALKAARKRRQLTQKQLAQRLGVHYNTISSWELGTYLPETRGLVLELARHLQLDEQETRLLLEASLTALSPHWNIPYQRNPFFTGRDDVLRHLHALFYGKPPALLSRSSALSGLGGIGKTQTAIEYAYRYANYYSAVFWVPAQTYESLVSGFVAIADLLNLPEKREQEQSRMVAAVIHWLNGHDQWLLVFDNVEDIALVKGFLPAARHGFLLFTSRRQALGLTAQVLDLDPMTPEEGMHFLLSRTRILDATASLDQLAHGDNVIAREIAVIMDGLPLALDQAGSYIEATQCGLSAYLQLLRSSPERLLDQREVHADHPLSVIRTFTLAFEQLERSSPRAAELLTVCAFLAPEAIPETFFSEGAEHLGPTFEVLAADPFAFHETLKTLLTYSLLQRNAATHTMTIHRLVQATLKRSLSKAIQHIWMTRIVRAMNHLFPSDETAQVDYWKICERLLPHALECIALSEPYDADEALCITSLMSHVAIYLLERARYTQAEPLFQQALHLGEQTLGTEHPQGAEALHGLASISIRQGKYEQAEQLFRQALRIREQALGAEHPQVAASLNGLATLYSRQGKYEQAEQLFRQALHIREQALGSDHPQVAVSLNGLAILYGEQGKYEQAEPLYQRALHIREQVLGTEHPQVATLLNNMAHDYSEQGRYEQAEPLFQRALHIWEQELGSDHPRVAYPLNNLAELYREQGRYEQAEPLFQRALHIWEQTMGPEHFLVADALDGLALLYSKQRKDEQAEPLFQQALQIREQALGPQHPYVAVSLTGLATLYREQGKYEQAELLYLQALRIRELTPSSQYPYIAENLHHLARLRQMQQQTTQALSLYQQALTIRERVLGLHHPQTRTTRCAYIQLLRELGHAEEATILEKKY